MGYRLLSLRHCEVSRLCKRTIASTCRVHFYSWKGSVSSGGSTSRNLRVRCDTLLAHMGASNLEIAPWVSYYSWEIIFRVSRFTLRTTSQIIHVWCWMHRFLFFTASEG